VRNKSRTCGGVGWGRGGSHKPFVLLSLKDHGRARGGKRGASIRGKKGRGNGVTNRGGKRLTVYKEACWGEERGEKSCPSFWQQKGQTDLQGLPPEQAAKSGNTKLLCRHGAKNQGASVTNRPREGSGRICGGGGTNNTVHVWWASLKAEKKKHLEWHESDFHN